MAAAEGPLLFRRRLGVELKRLRGERTLDEVAEATLISTSKLSRLENAQGVPQPRDIRDLVSYYELDQAAADRLRRWASSGRSQAWWRDYSADLPDNLDTYLDFESGASTIRQVCNMLVPALLQTRKYVETWQAAVMPARSEEFQQRMLQIVQRRQERVLGDAASRLIVVLDEAVLRRPFGSTEDMREQLGHLHEASRLKNVSLTVVPLGSGLHAGLQGAFTILQYADDIDRDIVALESHTREGLYERPADVLEYLRIFDAVSHRALDHDESRALIAEIRSQYDSPKGST